MVESEKQFWKRKEKKMGEKEIQKGTGKYEEGENEKRKSLS